jgi:hypothetical protein
MKYYETHYDDYINAVEKYNMHPELIDTFEQFPKKNSELNNCIFYGPTGSGKYSQVLKVIKKYSPSDLKYDKKITLQNEKQTYMYRISDIHYELDMSLLGCNSKIIWHEAFLQIIDIISVKQDKFGIIVCKNFHLIHSELLEIFYSYIQQYNSQSVIKLKFFIITEHISFIPTNILNSCQIINIKRPNKDEYKHMFTIQSRTQSQPQSITHSVSNKINILNQIDLEGILNLKETRYFSLLNKTDEIPKDIFNIICDNIIQEMSKKEQLSFTDFRDTLYDILTYNLDVTECFWYILRYFIENQTLNSQDITDILDKSYYFLKYYNNNYRPIYHLESIMFYIINKIHKYDEL